MNSSIGLALSDNHVIDDSCVCLTNKIKAALYDIASSFVYIGFLLAECEYFKTYEQLGYSSIHEYAFDQFGFKKSSTYNFINVCKQFSSSSQNAESFNFPFSMTLKDDYKKFNYSQLVEMLSMSDKQRLQVTSDMSVKQIRKIKNKKIDFVDDYHHYFVLQCNKEEFEFSISRKVNGKNYELKVCGIICDPSDIHPEGYFISFEGSTSTEGFCISKHPFTVIDHWADKIKYYLYYYDKPDDSRRLEDVPEEAPVSDSSLPVLSDVDYIVPHSDDLRFLFNDIEHASLFNDLYDGKDLFDIVQDFFDEKGYVILKKVR